MKKGLLLLCFFKQFSLFGAAAAKKEDAAENLLKARLLQNPLISFGIETKVAAPAAPPWEDYLQDNEALKKEKRIATAYSAQFSHLEDSSALLVEYRGLDQESKRMLQAMHKSFYCHQSNQQTVARNEALFQLTPVTTIADVKRLYQHCYPFSGYDSHLVLLMTDLCIFSLMPLYLTGDLSCRMKSLNNSIVSTLERCAQTPSTLKELISSDMFPVLQQARRVIPRGVYDIVADKYKNESADTRKKRMEEIGDHLLYIYHRASMFAVYRNHMDTFALKVKHHNPSF